jgi:hypothetical protein
MMGSVAWYSLLFSVGGVVATICIFVGKMYANFVTRDKYDMDKNELHKQCLHTHKNVAERDVAIGITADAKLEKHSDENKVSFDKIEQHLNNISNKIDEVFQRVLTDIALLKERTK